MSTIKQLVGVLVCVALVSMLGAHAQPLSRTERQTLSRELGAGLTGTGTSFNSLDPYYGYPQQQTNIFNGVGYEDQRAYDPGYTGLMNPNYGLNGYKNRMTVPGVEYDPAISMPVNGLYPDAADPQSARSSWRGFGYGRNPYGVPNTKNGYGGVKY